MWSKSPTGCLTRLRASSPNPVQRAVARLTRALVEKHGLRRFVVGQVLAGTLGCSDLDAALDGRAGQHGLQPPLEMRELLDVLALPLPALGPSHARDVGDRVVAGEKFVVGQPAVH